MGEARFYSVASVFVVNPTKEGERAFILIVKKLTNEVSVSL